MAKKNKKNKSITLVVIIMAVVCLFVGYLVGVNLLQWMKGGNEQVAQTENQVAEETQISNEEQEISSEVTQEESSQTENTESQQLTNNTSQNSEYENLFKIQVGAFSKRSNAVGFRNELEDKGYNVIIKEASNYKVRVIGKETREKTEKIEAELANLGYDTFIVK
ncbi:MAG: SPOR domain-containing protein [Halanaerobiales bacterium]|nr:SPOR domain-containing protein [Halanaerobiales bacterium]